MVSPRDDDAELQQLKQQLDPLVFGREIVSLDEGFVPRGPETTGFEVEPRSSSFYGSLPASGDGDEDEDEDDDVESSEVPENRYAGVIYASRFFVTRVGFLRSVKRLMVLSSNHLTIVDPYTEEVKERYAFDNIKEITIASDSGGHNADRAFTIFIGKNLKETYTCRCRQQLLSAYYQLRERASSFRKDEIDAATADALSAVGASMGTSDNNWMPGAGAAGGATAGNAMVGTGMYFDSLFQLCGKTFTMTKLSTTRSIAIQPIKVDVLLAVRAASLDRLNPQTRTTLSSILLIDIVKIQRVTTNSNELLLYFENNRIHRYWCDSREPFIQALANNLRSWLSVSLVVEEVSDSCEFDALTSTRDIPQPVSFEIPVLKISKNKTDKLQLRLLGLTALAIIERDPVTRKTLASHALNDIFNVVMYPSVSPSQDDSDSDTSEGLSGKFALELKHGLTRRYICLSATVSRRDKEVGLGLKRVTSHEENELRQLIGDIAGDIDVPDWLKVAGSTALLSPKEARSLFLSNMIEMCRMNKLHVPWSTEETKIACKEGTWGTEIHPEWEDILLRKLVNLNFIPNLVTNESMTSIFHQLVQFNRNIPLGGLRQRDRRAFASLMKLLESFKDYSVAQLNSPSNTDAPIPTTEFQVELLLAIQRLLCTRGVFEEVPSSQYKNSIEVIMELLHSPMEEVSFAAACVIKYMVINYSDTRSMKSETANRRAIFTKYHSKIFVSQFFDRLGKSYVTKDLVWGPNAVEELIQPKHGEQGGSNEEYPNPSVVKKKKKSAKNVPRWFVAWNCNEFRVDYESLHNEVKVGPYYLANILDDRGVLVEDIECADKFMTLLYYRLLAEDRTIAAEKAVHGERYSSADSLSDVDQSDIRLLVLKVMIQLYERHFNELGSLVFLNHFLRVAMMISKGGEDRRWPLVVRGNIMLFLDRVLSSALNVSRFLREEDNVTMVLDLLREIKPLVDLQGPNDSDKEYIVEPAADVQAELDASDDENEEVDNDDEFIDDKGEYDEEEDVEYEDDRDMARRTIDALEESGAESSIISSSSVSPTYAHRDDDSQHEEEPSRVTVVAEHCGAMSSSMIMQTCLSVLSRLIDCHTAEDEGHMYQDVRFPKYGRLTHFEGSGVSPISDIKRRLCEDQTLRFLVGLLDCPNRIVFKKCLGLIRLLVRHNETVIPNLHASGIFYYLLRFAQDVDEMSIAARLISHIHLRQSGLDVPHLIDDKQKGENKKGVFSPDPLTRICLKSWLVRVLPVSMVAQLLRHGPRRFANALFSDSNNPEVVWNANMRSQMVSYIEKFMERHTDVNGMFYISENEGSDHKACIALIQYPKEVHALQCYQYYLHNLLDEKNFPGWPINDEIAFLRALLDSIHRWVHPELLLTARGAMASDGQSTKLLSVFDAVELLDATALLLRRFPDSSCIINLRNFSYFLEALERCISELKDNRIGSTKTFFDVSKAIATKTTFVKAFGSAIRVINLAVGISDENAHECSSGLGLRVLCNSLQLLFHNQEALSYVDGCTPNVMTHWVLEALVNVLNQPNGRVSAAAQSLDLLPCLTRFLSRESDHLATDLSLQIVYEMAGSSGEMAEVLLLQLAEHGVLWYLTLLLFNYQPNNENGDGDMQRISIGAAKALGRILEANAKEESIAVFVKRMQVTIEQIFTRPLVDILRRAGPIKMLDVLASEVREPHVMWTDPMRKELMSLAQRAIQFHGSLDQSGQEVHKVFELPTYFMYTAQKEELCVAGIYVNFFNENPKNGILAQIAGTVNGNGSRADFARKPKPTTRKEIQAAAAAAAELENRTVSGHVMHGLLAALSHDISGVRAQPQALESVLLQRLLPVATAVRHLLQYTPDMDVQVVQADGLLTLLFILDHEAQPQGFSFACAPLLQLRCMECVHMLSFSGKCVDPLATVVPPFIKSAFQVVYRNLVRTEASTEGQLARITLQLLGNLCLIPACIDNLVKGMDPASLSNLLPHVWLGDSTEMQLLLCLHMIPLKRHTQAATEFAKAAVSSQLAAALLNLLSTLVPKSKIGESTATKQFAARFLSVLSSNPGSGGAISSLLIASRVWETHGDTTQATSEDLRRLLVPPHSPALLKAPHANPNKVG
ncbi:hypothetical protein BBO99_00008062 [Phytophthora kernoviae]|uniref:DnaJ homologue subfamily C GRV2/DNAJC13 N-terminal domain-containing protein n=1 Tax=Phytophthora kernoviae TaxID=325452 RepID=A0A3R7KQS9_9STRA|nr:hypothetical protein JM16_006880 [Phytophthora kernoviae]RLN32346.1 hypothetical protein BBI17_007988 [Phytophthora kernoviae]RLN75802.1 hypothetical protein BBO99_00008062 [Phytophthora kernoviae]